jgi:hypothetical protein
MTLADDIVESAAYRLMEAQLYENVAAEVTDGHRHEGLWIKALAQNEGNERAAAAAYVLLRVQHLLDEWVIEEADRSASSELLEAQVSDQLINSIRGREPIRDLGTYKWLKQLWLDRSGPFEDDRIPEPKPHWSLKSKLPKRPKPKLPPAAPRRTTWRK